MDIAAKNSTTAKDIFLAASRLSNSAERARFLDDVCQSNLDLRKRIEHMLAADESATTSPLDRMGAMLHHPEMDARTRSNQAPLVDAENHPLIGRYKLLEQIGEGGMGVVYVALQQKPIRRTVALKIIKPGMDSRQVVARFEAERQALAMMNHPHIAKVLDAGSTDSGSPYFVMELVKGIPITEFCDRHQVDVRQRLELFIKVCDAVQHAHLKGVIHRDLKPSNILVELENVKAVPKIIDFGVAKATQQTLTERTLHTGFSQMIGTPLYMSPEQAQLNSLDVDTRSDIYSLGVLLYELLTGSTPFDRDTLKEAGFDEMRRIIREVDPPRPSHRITTLAAAQLSTVSSQRQIDPRKLSSTMRGELDWIVMKALEKDRTRRYESASSLAADVQRFLDGDAVLACPPTRVYRMVKFARRYRVWISTAALIAIVLTVGLVTTAWQAFRASRAEQASNQSEEFATQQLARALQSEKEAKQQAARANLEAAIAIAVNEFIANDLIGKADPSHEPDRNILLRVVVDRAAATIAQRFQGQPLVEAAVRRTLGETFESLGEYHQAEEQLSQVLAICSREFGDRHSDSLTAKHKLATVISKQGRALEAQKLFDAVLEIQRSTLGVKHLDTLRTMRSLIGTNLDVGDFRDLEARVRELWEFSQRTLGNEHAFTLDTMNDVGAVLDHLGRYRDAEEVFRN